MTQIDNTMQEALERHLEDLKTAEDQGEWIRDNPGWRHKQIPDSESSQFMVTGH